MSGYQSTFTVADNDGTRIWTRSGHDADILAEILRRLGEWAKADLLLVTTSASFEVITTALSAPEWDSNPPRLERLR